jgi:glycosyltransferase involved in cell wall biosynthesis
LCWAYNEEASIAEYLLKASRLMDSTVEDYEIILIDDGSTDQTYEIARSFQKDNPRLKLFQNGRNLGSGSSSRTAIQKASKEFLFWQTIDWSYDISNLRTFLEYLRTYDIVQGVRIRSVGGNQAVLKPLLCIRQLLSIQHLSRRSDTIRKGFVSVVNYVLIRLLFRVPLSDFQNVTFYPTKWIQSVQFEAKSSFVNPEGLIKSYWSGMTIKEVHISFLPRKQGISKGTRIRAIKASIYDIFRLWFKWIILGRRGRIKKGKIIPANSLNFT